MNFSEKSQNQFVIFFLRGQYLLILKKYWAKMQTSPAGTLTLFADPFPDKTILFWHKKDHDSFQKFTDIQEFWT